MRITVRLFLYCLLLILAGNRCLAADAIVDTSNWSIQDDHQNMLEQLGVTNLRPGPNGRAQAGEPNAANYDPAMANPYPNLPDPLVTKAGKTVATPDIWWVKRRPEIAEDFEREIVGRIPDNVPKVTWSTKEQSNRGSVNGIPVYGKQLVGNIENSSYPNIDVAIEMTLVTPANAVGPVPVLIMFSGRNLALPEPMLEANENHEPRDPNLAPPSPHTLIAKGWGYAYLNPQSIQADNGAGLTKGIIGLVNKGQPRKPDDWGALRAWAWGASRALDYLETDSTVDAARAGIEGVSRYGKAALVALAFEPRFVMGLIGSSGEGGASLYRRNFGEAVENITSSGEYHWMAGNFLKYGAEESVMGRLDANDIPVDAHQLISLCAPRLTFISYGIPERGDALWLDQQGSYMATVAAGPVFRLLGVKDIGDRDHYNDATMPPVNKGLLDGKLAWRQHDSGHEDRTNMKHFIEWANRHIGFVSP